MAIPLYLAMTAAEFATCSTLPDRMGWLSCHFSAYQEGLSNIPVHLPPGSLLILDDSTPFSHHRTEAILAQLEDVVEYLKIGAVLLDFQRADHPPVQKLVARLHEELPCPVIAPPGYARDGQAVFLPPVPLNIPLSVYLSPYKDREIWLDAAPLPLEIAVTPQGSRLQPLSTCQNCTASHEEAVLHCHYGIEIRENQVKFTLCRTGDDFQDWLQEAQKCGVVAAVGLYQEWKQ